MCVRNAERYLSLVGMRFLRGFIGNLIESCVALSVNIKAFVVNVMNNHKENYLKSSFILFWSLKQTYYYNNNKPPRTQHPRR